VSVIAGPCPEQNRHVAGVVAGPDGRLRRLGGPAFLLGVVLPHALDHLVLVVFQIDLGGGQVGMTQQGLNVAQR
jgi:hypothetical protein